MISPLDIARLANDVYRRSGGATGWQRVNEINRHGFFAAKYVGPSNEHVIAIRGTRTPSLNGSGYDILESVHDSVLNIVADGAHLLARESPYVNMAREFVHANYSNNLVITGHSLGGFLAVTMAYHFTCKVVAFNPPWSLLGNLAPQSSASFNSSKCIIYHNAHDIITGSTGVGMINPGLPNVRWIQLGLGGNILSAHYMGRIINAFRNRTYQIQWP